MKRWFVAWRHHEVKGEIGAGVESRIWWFGPLMVGWDRQIASEAI